MEFKPKKVIPGGRLTAVTAVVALSMGLFAPVPTASAQGQHAEHHGGASSTTGGMMQQCRDTMKECQAMMGKLRAARDSNDPAKMRAAIDDALQTCAQMNANMSKMTNMMHMQGMHHGNMMGTPATPPGGSQQ